jgi:subtilase family serine protease
MKKKALSCFVAALCIASLSGVSGLIARVPTFASSGPGAQHIKVCGPPRPGYERCHAILVIPAGGYQPAVHRPSPTPKPSATGTPTGTSTPTATGTPTATSTPSPSPTTTTGSAPTGYGPADLQSAYKLPSSTAGSGQTVAIVDAYDDPNAESDLAVYRSQYGLPACTTANGCFKKVNQSGGTGYPAADGGWSQEISLDLDMVSAVCPNCHILLVEANSASINDLGLSVNEAVALGANEVSNSYGGAQVFVDPLYDPYYNHPGVAITASSGDGGYGVDFPASSPYVTAVGGTSLTKDGSARGWAETAWSGGGSGCSSYESKPSWQTDTGCSNRTVVDVSAVADPNTAVAVYDSFAYNGVSGWLEFGGTSVSSPIIAGVYALAGNAATVNGGSYPYSHTGNLNDIASGSNSSSGCSPAYLCTAGAGYDGPTGLGTPNGTGAF